MGRAIVEHQTSEVGTEHISATMTAWLALAPRAMPEEYASISSGICGISAN
jgi:hypothetical protein